MNETNPGSSYKSSRITPVSGSAVIIPPQGYVKIRFWFNIPDQKPATPGDSDSPFVIRDNANIFAAWVQHCHILRHEDRGMMMVVNVKPKAEDHSH